MTICTVMTANHQEAAVAFEQQARALNRMAREKIKALLDMVFGETLFANDPVVITCTVRDVK